MLMFAKVKDLEKKTISLESALTRLVREFQQEKETLVRVARKELNEIHTVADQLRHQLIKRSTELQYVKVAMQQNVLML
jgi:Xaa-Pro aminopeptidase